MKKKKQPFISRPSCFEVHPYTFFCIYRQTYAYIILLSWANTWEKYLKEMLIFLDSECESGPRKDYWRILATHSLKVLKLMFLKCVERQTMESSNGESFKGYSRTFSVHVNPGFDAGGGRVFTLARQPKHRRDLPVLGSVLSHPSISDHTVCGIWRLPVWTAEFSTLGRERDRQRSNALQLLPINATSAFSLQLKSNFTGIRFRYTVDFLRGGWEEREKKKALVLSWSEEANGNVCEFWLESHTVFSFHQVLSDESRFLRNRWARK